MKKGDQVKITDGSYAVRVDKYETFPCIGLCEDQFEVIGHTTDRLSTKYSNNIHDIFIKNTVNNRIYLHSSDFVKLVKPKVKEIKISDLENEYGCKVKIIK